MTEQVGTPFTSYNQESSPRVLTGNFFEERALLATTGISRRRLVPPSSHPAPSAAGSSGAGDTTAHGFALPSIFPLPVERAANKAQPPTFRRVIEHTEQQDPRGWASHAHSAHQAPSALRSTLPGSFQGAPGMGPREASELRRLRQLAAAEGVDESAAAGNPQFATSYNSTFRAPSLDGLTIGAKVMKTRDGGPVHSDVNFLIEANIVSRATADRIYRRQEAMQRRTAGGSQLTASETAAATAIAAVEAEQAAAASAVTNAATGGDGEGVTQMSYPTMTSSWGGAQPTHLPDQEEPITIYSFDRGLTASSAGATASPRESAKASPRELAKAAAGVTKHVLTESFYGTGGVKLRPMDRNDQFTKLCGDVNQRDG